LPTTLNELGLAGMGGQLVNHMRRDKKREAGRVSFILARGIGHAFVDTTVELGDVAAFLDRSP
jgi:3-dehydroquinate synthase